MPRAFQDFSRWDGGINTQFDESDIGETDLADVSLWSVSKPGRIYTIANFEGNSGFSSKYNAQYWVGRDANNILARYGFIVFDADYTYANPAVLGATRYAVVVGAAGKFNVIHGFTSTSTAIDITTGTDTIGSSAPKPRMFWGEGALRVSDTEHGASSRVKWLGIVSYTRFTNAGDAWLNTQGSAAASGSKWIITNASQDAPLCDAGVDPESQIKKGVVYYGYTDDVFPPDTYRGQGLNLNISATTDKTDGGWQSTEYEFGQSLVYLGNQESLVTTMGVWDEVADAAKTSITLEPQQYWTLAQVFAGADSDEDYDGRVTGARIYARKVGQNKRWVLLLDCDFQRGVRRNTFDSFDSPWEKDGASEYNSQIALDIKSPSPQTYESLNGYSPKDSACSFDIATSGWADAAVLNRRCFLVGVRYYDDYSGSLEVKSDRVYYSALAKYDTFPTSNWIDIGVNDGESFTAVEGFANRLLAFKQGTLYIINVQNPNDGGWFLEAELKGMGVDSPDAVTKSEHGILFANKYGFFQFSGQGIPKELNAKIDKAAWTTDLSTASHYVQVGYDGISEQCIIGLVSESVAGLADASSPHYVFDFRTNSMVRHQSLMTDGRSNFTTIPDTGQLVWIEPASSSDDFYISKYSSNDLGGSWETDTGGTYQYFTTKLTDFGAAAILKRFYNLYIDYKTSAAYDFDIIINGETAIPVAAVLGQTNYTKAKFSLSAIPDSSTFQLKIANAGQASITINNISLEYRVLHKRAG